MYTYLCLANIIVYGLSISSFPGYPDPPFACHNLLHMCVGHYEFNMSAVITICLSECQLKWLLKSSFITSGGAVKIQFVPHQLEGYHSNYRAN